MAAKRNSRLYVDENTHHSEDSNRLSRRNSRNCTAEDLQQVAKLGDEEANIGLSPKDSAPVSPSETNQPSEKEPSPAVPKVDKWSVPATTTSLMAPSVAQPLFPIPPLEGRPLNFGLVIPGVYRSSYPKAEDYDFLQDLKLKTVVTLVKRDEIDHEFESFLTTNGVRQVIFNMKGTKKEAIPLSTMTSILNLVLDQRNYPLMIHCNHGKHRTGCVVALVRKISGWNIDKVLDEYKTYATPKIRECDVDYITSFQLTPFQPTSVRPVGEQSLRFTPMQVRSFLRTLLFSTFVVVIWTVSGSQMITTQERGPN
ncbi:putative tyrosine-protein phosphatase DSP2 [Cladobotryum mycophilum]|uniref:diphosphoinositol-polyphosphate diphosphatase n=1 Tax=Cladobotryum mycophilum TaxID=491253 RepID=A0ABR0T183_9HYPO